ncbi:MAG: phosphate acyltransferase PlsX [Peptoniphilus sp.]|nr:phosphate acyltransferase PlsX [Peptoniphilus sp.]MDY3119216.1 phosphate acyltransferase PlsX [Peptoniphilus sp.]
MKIAYDCQGGDHAPDAIVNGALKAKDAYGIEPVFFGDQVRLTAFDGVEVGNVVHCPVAITQEESPTMAIRRKKESAIVQGLSALSMGRVDGMISAGSTGALLAGGMFIVKREKGVERAALPVFLEISGQKKLILDVGANMDASPEMLVSFAQMGQKYLREVENVSSPAVALLNVGTEEGKGNRQTKAAYDLMKDHVDHFVGNIEARDVLFNNVNVIVADGFAGNVLLKSIEGTVSYIQQGIFHVAKEAGGAEGIRRMADQILSDLDYSRYGGVPLLGLQKPVFKAHGSSQEEAIVSATAALVKMIRGKEER